MALTLSKRFLRLLLMVMAGGGGATAQPCLTFLSPPRATPISSEVCTVSVEACQEVKSVEFTAHFHLPGMEEPRSKVIGTITRPPYKLVWDTKDIPNQYYDGMRLTATASLPRQENDTAHLEGIFLTHAEVQRPAVHAPYRSEKNANKSSGIIMLSSPPRPGKADIRISWNEKYLVFHIGVQDPFFYSDLRSRDFDKLGAEIMIDPAMSRKPFPTEQSPVFVVPLEKAPYRIISKPVRRDDGSFSIERTTREISYPHRVRTEDFKGYLIELGVPWSEIGEEIPSSLGLNLTVHLLDQASKAHKVAWNGTDEAVYAPILWGEVKIRDKPLLASGWLVWLLSFVGGGIAGAGLVLLYRLLTGTSSPGRFERDEQEEKLLHNIMGIIEGEITDANLSQGRVAERLSVSPRQVSRVLRRHHGEGFKECLMRSRVEVVKERLRSSHSSEAAIAASCGFGSVDEMEKYFKRFCRTTPYRFREEHQVT